MERRGVFVRLPLGLIQEVRKEQKKRGKSFQETLRSLVEERLQQSN